MFAMKRVAAAVGMLALAACGDSALSPNGVNTATLVTDVGTLSSTFDNNAAYQSLAQLSFQFPVFPGSIVQRTLPFSPAGLRGGSLLTQLRAARMLTPAGRMKGIAAGPRNLEALFPSNVLGRTYVWDATNHQYKLDSTITGAPTNGFRIRLYTVDPNTGEPVVPLQFLGYLQFTDLSTAQQNQIGLVLTLASTTIADYTVTATQSTSSSTLAALGFIRNADGSGRVDFDLRSLDNDDGSGTFTYTLTGQGGAQISVHAVSTASDTEDITLHVGHGENGVDIIIHGTASSTTGQVKFNGTLVATFTQSGEGEPVFTGANGHQLTAQQIADIQTLFGGVLIMVAFTLFAIFAPAFVVF